MGCCTEKNKVRVHPGAQQKQFVRLNGWTSPLHYLQVIAWVILFLIALVYFGVVAIAVVDNWKPAAYVCVGILLILHGIFHIIAIYTDPADENASERIYDDRPAPEFDRSKHAHVIENEFCHICETYVNKSSKHCRACNKCVENFDHHCLWLNNCVGKRNYRYFLATISTALLGSLVIATVSIFVFVNAILKFQYLDPNVWWHQENVPWILFEVFIGIEVLLCFASIILLGQLLCFHLILIRRGITTYDYIKNARVKEEGKADSSAISIDDDNCARAPDFIDTSVATKEDVMVIKMMKGTPQDAGMRQNYNSVTDNTNKSRNEVFVTNGKVTRGTKDTEGDISQSKMKMVHSRSEFTNEAFVSSDEPKNQNKNSNARISTNGMYPESTLGELGTWEATNPQVSGGIQSSKTTIIPTIEYETHSNDGERPHSGLGDIVNDDATIVSNGEKIHQVLQAKPENSRRPHRSTRKRTSKRSMLHREDGAPRPLPILPEVSNPAFVSGESPRLRNPMARLPPLRNSVDWASSSEDIRSSVNRKLPPLSASNSVNSLVSYASLDSGSIVSSHYSEHHHV